MANPNSPDDRLSSQLDLLRQTAEGNLDDLLCPTCGTERVSVWFTQPAPNEYRTWFLCGNCDFHTRVHNLGKPTHFADSRRRLDLEERDRMILQQAAVKKPGNR